MSPSTSELTLNPFAVKTPESLGAKELVELFVPYPEFNNLQMTGHQFLHGHRGSGKSMMLRMMAPDSQMLYNNKRLSELSYFGVYLSIKATELNAPEFVRLETEPSGTILSEHVLTTKLLSSLFVSIRCHCFKDPDKNSTEVLKKVIEKEFLQRLKYAGWEGDLVNLSEKEFSEPDGVLQYVIALIDEIQSASINYIKRRSFTNEAKPYTGALLSFQEVMLPIITSLATKKLIPAPVYFLLDDADNLSMQQTMILNTWVSYRTTEIVSLKISTQLNYKTYKTTSKIRIEAPHDFSAIHFTSVQTGSVKERYPKLVEQIVRKRLEKYGIKNTDPQSFFPNDPKQVEAIKEIAEEIKQKWEKGQSGYRPGDDAYRYARPEYIRRLAGASKQGSTYKYAGFEQLVHLSSGIIRFFLEPAARMFTEQHQRNKGAEVTHIAPSVQDSELRKQADDILLGDFDRLMTEAQSDSASPEKLRDIQRLRNIIYGLGSLFKAHILDETASQRRVFSFSITGGPSEEINKILHLGVINGYFYLDGIGSKTGMGRERLYVLTRRLSPAFSLDPVGFSAYLTVTNKFLSEISEKPQAFINRVRDKNGLQKALSEIKKPDDQLSFL